MDRALLERSYLDVKSLVSEATPSCGLILGSGLSDIVSAFTIKQEMDYTSIRGLDAPSVAGHGGKLILGELGGLETFVFCGRRHWYEGCGWEPIAAPIYILRRFGVGVAVLTNAAGAIAENFRPGDIMVIDDHIDCMGSNPLVGPHDEVWGPRFPDQSCIYDAELRRLLDAAAERASVELRHGVYVARSGPAYETPAEIRAFRTMGASAVGMSTVPEAILASAAGMRVAGLSCMANAASGLAEDGISHKEVLRAMAGTIPRMEAVLRAFFEDLSLSLAA